MREFLKRLTEIPEVMEMIQRVQESGCPIAVNGLQPVQRACISAAVAMACGRRAVFLCGDEREAQTLSEDLTVLTGENPVRLYGREWQLRPGTVSSRVWEQNRLAALYQLAQDQVQGQAQKSQNHRMIVTTVDGFMMRTLSPELLLKMSFCLQIGQRLDLHEFTERLIAAGYVRCEQVEGVGQFALRGGILDVFSPLMLQPVRCEFFDDEIDSMGLFDRDTQRRIKNIESAQILPASEVLLYSNYYTNLSEKLDALVDQLEQTQHQNQEHKNPKDKKQDKKQIQTEAIQKLIERLRTDIACLQAGGILDAPDRYLAAVYPEFMTGLDYLPDSALVILSESGRVEERVKNTLIRFQQDSELLIGSGVMAGEYADLFLTEEEFYDRLEKFPVILESALPTSRQPLHPRALIHINTKQLSSYGGSLETAVSDLEHYRTNQTAILALCGGETRAKNLHRILEEHEIPAVLKATCKLNQLEQMPGPGQVLITIGALSAGSEWPQLKLAVLTEGQLTNLPVSSGAGSGRRKNNKNIKSKRESNRQKLQSYTDLSPGDLVVHIHHGVGRFAGIQQIPVDGVQKDYIKIDYAGGDCLYVPVTQLDFVSKYIGGGENQERTKLHKLSGTEWNKQKTRAKKAAKDLAKGLIALYAERQKRPGFAFSPDSPWQREFEDAFDYPETEDQLRSIAEIKADMELPRPMDRLLCGDVGYGKTEVALRAIMKCILDGKQAAILVPTTVLAQQHFATASSRFRNFPVKIETLSRFTSARESKRILSAVQGGRVDLLIGTHKLLQKNIIFKDLGLLVIDEEQRFGVSHKERLKEMSRQVDVLTLSATPIPRTLNMALTGIRDMSTLEEPPLDRQPVQTYVMEHEWGIMIDAIHRELNRGGQVYYLHNRIDSIDRTAARLQELLGPDVRIVIGHGKISEQELSRVMRAMINGEADILVCTTIIETGIDIPNVNTLIIEDADKLGLSQLHQIRGRIGRSVRRAYAYLTYRPGKILQETAAKRLAAIREYVEFGSGFKIAMRDLEIRGAGNLLGPEQSGYLMTVGYDLYLKLLEEAVLEEKGETKKIETDCSADITVNAHIPEYYVPSPEQRMDLYRRIAAIRTNEDASDLLDELLDRYGEAPKSVMTLLKISLLRVSAAEVGISDISQRKDILRFRLANFEPAALASVCGMAKYRHQLTLSAGDTPMLSLKLQPGVDVLAAANELVEHLRI